MAKDYAKRVYTSKSRKKPRRRVELFLAPLVLLIGAVLYWGYSHPEQLGKIAEHLPSKMQAFLLHQKPAPTPETPPAKKVPQAKPAVHFDFYNQLPAMQVTPSETDASAAPPTDTPVQYIVQFGVFKDPASASELRVSLMLAGIEAEIVKLNAGEQKSYRLQSGPYLTKLQAENDQKRLQKKGIVGMVKKAD